MIAVTTLGKWLAWPGWRPSPPGLSMAWLGPLLCVLAIAEANAAPVTFNKNFEGASLGKIEKIAETQFRCAVEGQCDERGRNRQATWYYFRMDGVLGQDLTLTLTDLVGEYNDKPGACAMNSETVPVFSYDDEHWQHVPSMQWDNERKEATLKLHCTQDQVWVAHVPPYPCSRLNRLLKELGPTDGLRDEVVGRSVQGRDLHLLTVTDFGRPDEGKKVLWVQARQHAWEAGTSWVMEGALRFICSNDPEARLFREKNVFCFVPMMDPDGAANGRVRFNANGYDVNRHWDEVDLRQKHFLDSMPEIWYIKKAVAYSVAGGKQIDLFLNLHNTETAEYFGTQIDDPLLRARAERFFGMLVSKTSFDPSNPKLATDQPAGTTGSLWKQLGAPVVLIEQRIGISPKLGRRLLTADRLEFGKGLIECLAQAVVE